MNVIFKANNKAKRKRTRVMLPSGKWVGLGGDITVNRKPPKKTTQTPEATSEEYKELFLLNAYRDKIDVTTASGKLLTEKQLQKVLDKYATDTEDQIDADEVNTDTDEVNTDTDTDTDEVNTDDAIENGVDTNTE